MCPKYKKYPDFKNPPVIEVYCGILYKPIEKLLAPHLGLLWDKFKKEYPKCQEVPPLMPVLESKGKNKKPEFNISELPPLPRVWFLQSSGNSIIQIQRELFIYNWRKILEKNEYPRYKIVFSKFLKHLGTFKSFLNEMSLEEIIPQQYEMTYVNYIPQGKGWNSKNEIGKIFPDFNWQSSKNRFLPPPEGFLWQTHFNLPENSGSLRIKIQKVQHRQTATPTVRFELMARGISKDTSFEGMKVWFDMAHEWIVCGFCDLTDSKTQRNIWGRIE